MSLKILKPSKNHFISKVSSESKHPKTHMLHGMGLEYIYLQYVYHKFEPLKCRLKSSSPNLTKAHLFFFQAPKPSAPWWWRIDETDRSWQFQMWKIASMPYNIASARPFSSGKQNTTTFDSNVRGGKSGGGVDCFIGDPFFFRGSNPWNSYAHPGSPVSPFFSPVGFPSFTIFFRYGVYHLPKGTTIF